MYVGLDIGGTKIVVASSDEQGKIIQRLRADTPLKLQEGIDLLIQMIHKVSVGTKINGIGAAIGGPLDWQQGNVSPLHQPEWRNVPLKKIIQEIFNCPFHVDVDTNIAALGEYNMLEKKPQRFLYMTVSTGIGGGFLINGNIYRGMKGEHPEVGHQTISYTCNHPDRVKCECGANDCLEALVSGNGIRRIYHKPAEDLNKQEWRQVAYNLGKGLRNCAIFYAPDLIVLGGGVALGGGQFLVEKAYETMTIGLNIVPQPDVRLSRLDNDTPLIGALVAAKNGLQRSPIN